MSRPNINSALLVLLLLSAATSALPAARSSSSNGDGDKNTPQRLELPQSDEQPLYMRLDDVLEPPGTDPTVVVVSQGRIIRGGGGDSSSIDNKNTPSALARILSAPLQLVRDVFRGGDRDQDQDRHEEEEAAAAAAAAELRRRVDNRGELGGREHHHDHVHQHQHRHPLPPHPPVRDGSSATTRRLLERRGKIRLYGYRYPDPEVEGEGKGMKGAQGGVVAGTRWQD